MFQGYLIKTKYGVFPNALLDGEGYKSTPNTVTDDENSYVDGTGLLHRSVLPHTRTKIWMKTRVLTGTEKELIQKHFPKRQLAVIEYWNDEDNAYKQGNFYIPDIDWTIKHITPDTHERLYAPVEITLIEY